MSEERTNLIVSDIQQLVHELHAAGRTDLLLQAIGVPLLEELRMEAAKRQLSRLTITRDYRFILDDYNRTEIVMQPVHKAVYMLFLAHEEGIEFKHLSDYRDELKKYYSLVAPAMEREKIEESVERLTNLFDNAINEKCSRIKNTFLSLMDEYRASYYIISGHMKRHVAGSAKVWYERRKNIALPRHLVTWEKP
ncbi:MAG: hypothetical protein IJ196_04195 [Prevotella sp.]|nr:hypothetical protein [Prevotella sp.]